MPLLQSGFESEERSVSDNILVTGMSGLIGSAVRRRLEPRARLAALNRSEVPGVTTVRADLVDLDAIRPAFEGRDTVIHLAAKAGDRHSWEALRDTNVIGTRNVLEAARLAGCRRVVFASSGATVAGWEREEPYRALVEGRYGDVPEDWVRIRHDMATRPNGPYASTKVWGEALARHYADAFDLLRHLASHRLRERRGPAHRFADPFGVVQPARHRQCDRARRRCRRIDRVRHLLRPVRQPLGLSRSLAPARADWLRAAGTPPRTVSARRVGVLPPDRPRRIRARVRRAPRGDCGAGVSPRSGPVADCADRSRSGSGCGVERLRASSRSPRGRPSPHAG